VISARTFDRLSVSFFSRFGCKKKKSFTDSTFSSLSFCGLFLLGFICKHTHTPKETKLPLKKRKRIEQKKQSTETKKRKRFLCWFLFCHISETSLFHPCPNVQLAYLKEKNLRQHEPLDVVTNLPPG